MGSQTSIEENEVQPESETAKGLFETSSRERRDFARFWEQYVPGGARSSTVSRPLIREVLLRAVRDLALSPIHRAWAEDLVANAISGSPAALSAEEAFQIYAELMKNLQPAYPASPMRLGSRPTVTVPTAVTTVSSTSSSTVRPTVSVNNYAKMPKGSRTVDPAPLRRMSSSNAESFAFTSMPKGPGPQDLFTPIRATRAAQESSLASLRATVLQAQGTYEKLLARAESYRDGGGQQISSATREAKAQVDRDFVKLQDQASLIQQQAGDVNALQDNAALQLARCEAVQQRLEEAEEKLEEAQQENAELLRQHKTEELRATMLREAFEQEQNRVGVSLGQAESYVKDLVTATEGTRQVEMKEQAVARECMQELNEIHAAQTREDLGAEAKLNQLIRELELAKSDYAASTSVTASTTALDSAKQSETAEYRRSWAECSAVCRRRMADAQVCRRKWQEIQQRAEMVNRDLAQHEHGPYRPRDGAPSEVSVLTRLRLEEAEEAQQKAEEARLESELMEAEKGSFKQDASKNYQALLEGGHRQLKDLQLELEQLRLQLSAAPPVPAMPGRAPSTPADNLMAAGLQRRVGVSLAAGRQSQCLLQEEQLKRQLAEQRLVDRQGQREVASEISAVADQPDVQSSGSLDASQELRARLAALRGQLSQGASIELGDTEGARRPLHEQLQALRLQLEQSASETLR